MKKTRGKIKLPKKDRVMITIIMLLVFVITPILIVYSKSTLSESKIEVEKMNSKIDRQKTVNESISMKINELASLSNIQDIAKANGLNYNNDNIIVVK